MKRKELLIFMKGRISQRYFDILVVWTKKRKKKFLFFNRKFDVNPLLGCYAYKINSTYYDYIVVYNDKLISI